LARVARNVLRQSIRADRRRERREATAVRPDEVPAPEAIAELEAVRRRVVDAVLALEEPYRAVILLRFYQDLPLREIARRTQAPLETVRTRLRRGLDRLRERLDAEHGGNRVAWSVPALALAAPAALRVSAAAAALAAVAACVVAAVATIASSEAKLAGAPREAGEVAMAPSPATRQDEIDPQRATAVESRLPAVARDLRVRGRVVDPQGAPVSGATVVAVAYESVEPVVVPSAAARSDLRVATTDGVGEFALELPAPVSSLLLEKPGHSTSSVDAVRAGDDVNVSLDPPRAIEGRVLDEKGAPIEGAIVRWQGFVAAAQVEREGRSDGDGSFRVDGLPSAREHERGGLAHATTISVEAEGFAAAWLDRMSDPAPSRLDLTLERGTKVVGRVVDAETAEAVPHATVVVRRDDETVGGVAPRRLLRANHPPLRDPISWTREIAAGADGRFRLEGLRDLGAARGDPVFGEGDRMVASLAARAPGYADSRFRAVNAAPGREVVEATIRLWPSASISGRAVDAGGKPVFPMKIRLRVPGRLGGPWTVSAADSMAESLVASTDETGAYRFDDVPAARSATPADVTGWIETAGGPKWVGGKMPVELRAGRETSAADFVLSEVAPASRRIRVRVVDADGAPFPQARVRFHGSQAQVAVTDEAGRAIVDLPRGWADAARIVARAPGHAPSISEPIAVDADAEVQLVLEKESRVSGVVRTTDGAAVAGASVRVLDARVAAENATSVVPSLSLHPTVEVPLPLIAEATSGEDGRFDIGELPRASVHLVASVRRAVTENGWNTVHAIARDVAPSSTDVVLAVPPEPPRPQTFSVEANVVDARTGEPVSGHDAQLQGRGLLAPVPVEAGRIRFDGVTAGSWTVDVRAPGYVPYRADGLALTSGMEPLSIAMEPGGALRGRVDGPARSATTEMVVRVLAERGEGNSGRVDPDGSYAVRGLPSGRAWVTASVRGDEFEWVPIGSPIVEVRRGPDETVHDLHLTRAGRVSIDFGDADGGPLTIPEQTRRAQPYAISVLTADETPVAPAKRGAFGIACPPIVHSAAPGEVVVRLDGPDGARIERRVAVSAGAETRLTIPLPR
ncbi:MAG TPA: sigma-70 family RNA polymerase sigma factor, partial [Planctomycetota bacterium]|nr:sigma-70 family RNA polymerase sigma factor [Planctomycetota bacterium]